MVSGVGDSNLHETGDKYVPPPPTPQQVLTVITEYNSLLTNFISQLPVSSVAENQIQGSYTWIFNQLLDTLNPYMASISSTTPEGIACMALINSINQAQYNVQHTTDDTLLENGWDLFNSGAGLPYAPNFSQCIQNLSYVLESA